ncbi:hypothetical protein N9B24_00980 [bacterium]|nr:hypothetical protein [bacterium]
MSMTAPRALTIVVPYFDGLLGKSVQEDAKLLAQANDGSEEIFSLWVNRKLIGSGLWSIRKINVCTLDWIFSIGPPSCGFTASLDAGLTGVCDHQGKIVTWSEVW